VASRAAVVQEKAAPITYATGGHWRRVPKRGHWRLYILLHLDDEMLAKPGVLGFDMWCMQG